MPFLRYQLVIHVLISKDSLLISFQSILKRFLKYNIWWSWIVSNRSEIIMNHVLSGKEIKRGRHFDFVHRHDFVKPKSSTFMLIQDRFFCISNEFLFREYVICCPPTSKEKSVFNGSRYFDIFFFCSLQILLVMEDTQWSKRIIVSQYSCPS